MANWDNCAAVERDTERHGGLWVFKGTQVPLYLLYETLASGATVDDFAARFGVDAEQTVAALEYETEQFRNDLLIRPDGPGDITPIPVILPTGAELPDWDNCPVVERIAGKVSGAWVFKGTRLPLYCLHGNLSAGATVDEFVEWYEGDRMKTVAVLEHEAKGLWEGRQAYAHSA